MYIIKEKIYGNMATVFHRTSVSDLVNKVYTTGFQPGDGAMYGKGFYATYELESQQRKEMQQYGNIIVKFAVPIENFFIFDYEEFIKSPNFKKLGQPSIENFLRAQLNYFKMSYKRDLSTIDSIAYTSDLAFSFFKRIQNFKKLCQGIIFTGRRDGHVLVAYDTRILIPLSYSIDDGETFESVEKNIEYLKKVSSIQTTKFEPNPSIKPEDFGIKKYAFTKDGFLDVFENVNLKKKRLTTIPFKFGHVHGDFNCSSNSLTSLKGSPRIVEGNFDCSNNRLTSLKDGPETVRGNYLCYESNLKSLVGSPKEVGDTFDCNANMLTTLEGGPKIVKNKFDCSFNDLTTLEGGPQEVGKEYDCIGNNIDSLRGAPSLILGTFNCKHNDLSSLEYCPKAYSIICTENLVNFSKEEIAKYLIH